MQTDDVQKDGRDTQVFSWHVLDMPVPDTLKAFMPDGLQLEQKNDLLQDVLRHKDSRRSTLLQHF